MKGKMLRITIGILAVLALGASAVPSGATAAPGPRSGVGLTAPITFVHTTDALSDIAIPPMGPGTSQAPVEGPGGMIAPERPENTPEGPEDEAADAYVPRSSQLPSSSLKVKMPSNPPPSFEALNHFDSRYSDGGNQWSGVPPDQGLCAGNGYVFEIVNSVMQIYAEDGTPQLPGQSPYPAAGPVGLSLNQFLGLPSAAVRPAGPFGPFLYDPSCQYDSSTQRWFAVVADLEVDPNTSAFTGYSGEYVAVSTSSDPTGTWNVWFIDTTNNGENGTPDHNCPSGYCFGDYPQIGLDDNGFYITTNDFDTDPNYEGYYKFNGAQLYALSKNDLVNGVATPRSAYLDKITSMTNGGGKAYSIIPVNQLAADRDTRAGGTAYFVMRSDKYHGKPSKKVAVWALTNTSSLNAAPAPALYEAVVKTEKLYMPWFMQQRKGPSPLVECQNIGKKCYGEKVPQQIVPAVLDTVGDRVSGAWRQGGQFYVTASTALKGHGAARVNANQGVWRPIDEKAGIGWMVISATDPSLPGFSGNVVRQGYAGVQGNNIAFSSVVVNAAGEAAIGVSLMGPDYSPSAAYMPMDPGGHPKAVRVVAEGRAPEDDFGSEIYGGWTRWGDYPAAAIGDDGSMWLANEYVRNRCNLYDWLADPTCGYGRSYYANWSTRITRIAP